MSDTKIDKAKYVVIYKGEEVLFSKECIKDMRIESPDTITVLGKADKDLTDKEKEKLSKEDKVKLEEKLKAK